MLDGLSGFDIALKEICDIAENPFLKKSLQVLPSIWKYRVKFLSVD